MAVKGKDSIEEKGSRPGVFLDRDGTIIRHVPYLADPGKIRLLPGAAAAIKQLNDAGIPVVLVSNQSGVARGLMTEAQVAAVNDELVRRLARRGAHLDRIEYCPHYPKGKVKRYAVDCRCRKPAPGMLLRAARALGLDFSRSIMIGDNEPDIAVGKKVGAKTVLLLSGHGRTTLPRLRQSGDLPDYVASSLAKALAWWSGQKV